MRLLKISVLILFCHVFVNSISAQLKILTPGGPLEMTRWAEHPMLQDPVALSFDNQGNLYVVETARRTTVDIDIRSHKPWILEDLSNQSIDHLRLFFRRKMSTENSFINRKWLTDRNQDGLHDWRDLTTIKETVRRLSDTNNDGKADRSTVFADGFNEEINGVAAGVLPIDDSVLMTIYPDLWKLKDTNNDGIADERSIMFRGFGVHAAFDGHDLHGLTIGPEGKIYFSVGDNGFSVQSLEGKQLHFPNTGGVLRMNPDGSDLEVFSYGTRNIQEIAFNEYGDWFSVDNDGDIKDERERFVYLVEGGDSGWRLNWQFQTEGWAKYTGGPAYNPWIEEKLWIPHFSEQPAYIFPPISNYSVGPGGFKFNPGTALSEHYRGYFFLCQFPVQKITAFQASPAGANYKMTNEHVFHAGLMASSLNFGPDGAMYIADWIGKWKPNQQGVIYKVDDAKSRTNQIRKQVQSLLKSGLAKTPESNLETLLGHEDQRIRLLAQFELVKRSQSSLLADIAADPKRKRLARIHALWGIVQLATVAKENLDLPLLTSKFPLKDPDAEIRGQAAKAVGELGTNAQNKILTNMLSDNSARVRYRAAIALGKVGNATLVPSIFEFIQANANQDAALRHAGVMALTGCATSKQLAQASTHSDHHVRSSVVVAMRRRKDPAVSDFLNDADVWVAKEAAMAIYDDFSITAALPELAKRLHEKNRHADCEAILRRAIGAAVRLGSKQHAEDLMRFADDDARPEPLRVEAILTLAHWNQAPMYDRVDGRMRRLAPRININPIVQKHLPKLFKKATPDMQLALITLTRNLNVNPGDDVYANWVADTKKPSELRVRSLESLAKQGSPLLPNTIKIALQDNQVKLRQAGLQSLSASDPEMGILHIQENWDKFELSEKQVAIGLLGQMDDAEAGHLLVTFLDQAIEKKWPNELLLELVQATEENDHALIQERFQKLKKTKGNSVQNVGLLFGGDANRGKTIYETHVTAQCIRCHDAGGKGKQAGPDLKGIGKKVDRNYLLQAILLPSETIAKGFDAAQIVTVDGLLLSGIVTDRNDQRTIIVDGQGKRHVIDNDDIEVQKKSDISSMPKMDSILTRREIRDLVEFLSNH